MKKINKILIASQVVLIVIIILISRSCENNKVLAELNQYKLSEYIEERQKFVTEINDKGETITTQEQVILSKDRKIEKKLLENSNLKRLNSQIKIKSETKIRDLLARYEGNNDFIMRIDTIHDTIIINKAIGVKFGTKFSAIDDWYHTVGKITLEGIKFDSISFKNDLTITVGRKREKWHKPMITYVEVKNNNPYTNVNSMNNVTIKKNKEKIWSKPWFNLLIGVAAGFTVGVLAE